MPKMAKVEIAMTKVPEVYALVRAALVFADKFEASGMPSGRPALPKQTALAWAALVSALQPFRASVKASASREASDEYL